MLANKLTNQSELTTALKRVEQLWDVQYRLAEGNEFHQLVDLIINYEGKNWDSYFNKVENASDDFLTEREGLIEQKGAVKCILSGVNASNDIDDSLQSSINEDLRLKKLCKIIPESKIELFVTIVEVWTKYPDLRLSQLVVNAINPKSPCPEIFYIEDSQLLYKIKQL